jgi:hypothetical protein
MTGIYTIEKFNEYLFNERDIAFVRPQLDGREEIATRAVVENEVHV